MADTIGPSTIDKGLLETLDRAFAHHAGADGAIDLPELQKALGLRSEHLARRVLAAFDLNRDGLIQRDEFIGCVRKLVFGTVEDKLRFAFLLHDNDGDGFIGQEDMLRMISISLAENDVERRSSQPPEHLSRALFRAADTNRDGRLSFEEFAAAVQKRPELLHQMIRSEAQWIAPNEDLLLRIEGQREKAGARILENRGLIVTFLSLWVVANGAVFVWGALRDGSSPPQNPLIQAARAFGVCLDLNGALILVPMMRRLLTRVRSSLLGRVVPVDEAIEFHKILGHAMFALAVLHSVTFAMGYTIGHSSRSLAVLLFETRRGTTGFALLVVFAVMWLFSLSTFRRSRRFELFYFTHLLYVAWFALAIAHGPSFVLWVAGPLVGFAIEQLVRLIRRGHATSIVKAEVLRSGVTHIDVARPEGFQFAPGDYAFIRIPEIAKREWHPFTISSAPERPELRFHVRSLGNWTSALRDRVAGLTNAPPRVPVKAYVDGPYGSPSAAIFASKNVVLIGAGIGVTPFASVLESIVSRGNGKSTQPCALEKAHFFWLNRDQYSFEWFGELLARVEADDARGMLDVHLCMTGARSGSTAMGLELARAAMHAERRSDIITGLRTKTHVGPPDWQMWLTEIARSHAPHPVDVFFCGPPGLARKLRPICARLQMPMHEERF